MVERRVTDGRRIAQLLASEVDGRVDGALARLSVANADRSVEGTPEGERAYDVVLGPPRDVDESRTQRRAEDEQRLARVFVHEDRVRVTFELGREAAATAASEAGLRVRPRASTPPATLVFVESGAEVKRAVAAFVAAAEAVVAGSEDGTTGGSDGDGNGETDPGEDDGTDPQENDSPDPGPE